MAGLLLGPALPYVAPTLLTVSVSDAVLIEDGLPTVSVSDAELIETEGGVLAKAPTSLSFGSIDVGADAELEVVITNAGDADVVVSGVSASGMFSADDWSGTLAPDEDVTIAVTFTPSSAGAKSGTLTVESDATNDPLTVALSGTGVAVGPEPLSRLHTAGRQILNEENEAVRLRSINWFGAEGTNYTPHGTWGRPFRDIIDQFAAWGFNCVRVPFSGDFVAPGRMPVSIAEYYNPDLAGLTALEVFDALFDYCAEKGVYVVLDHHRRTAGAGADGSPVDGSYTLSDWIDTWELMATRYAEHPAVIGADLHNEPHSLDWDTWAGYAEDCGDAILAIAPDWLIFVEGVGEYEGAHYWWGGQLAGVADRPVVLGTANRLVYSPHEYGESVAHQSWLAYDGETPPVGWPDNLYAVWSAAWGFIFENDVAPIWIGEFGGFFGYDGSGAETKPHADEERQWLAELANYLNGDLDNDTVSELDPGEVGMSFAYWALNPNSGDTGGLLRDDWITPQSGKLALLAPLLED